MLKDIRKNLRQYLLDFNVAEQIKRDATNGKSVHFSDILGMSYDLSPEEIIEPILPSIQNLANAIANYKQATGVEPADLAAVEFPAMAPLDYKETLEKCIASNPKLAAFITRLRARATRHEVSGRTAA